MGRCNKIVSREADRAKQRETTKEALKVCGYPQWAVTSVQNKMAQKQKTKKRKDKEEDKRWGIAMLPYVKGLTEKVARILKKRAMKLHTILRGLLVQPKDKADLRDGLYTIHCKSCDGKYVGETKRLLKTRLREHRNEV